MTSSSGGCGGGWTNCLLVLSSLVATSLPPSAVVLAARSLSVLDSKLSRLYQKTRAPFDAAAAASLSHGPPHISAAGKPPPHDGYATRTVPYHGDQHPHPAGYHTRTAPYHPHPDGYATRTVPYHDDQHPHPDSYATRTAFYHRAGKDAKPAGLFCSVLQPSSSRRLATPWTYFLHLSLSSVVILTDSSTESPVHVLMLSIHAVRGLPRLRAPGIVPCNISFSRQLPCFLMA